MLNVDSSRVTDPEALSTSEVIEALEQHGQLVVQFSKPRACALPILHSLNEACRLAESRLEVRFFGHYGTRFDAALLRHLPEARNLSVDCLTEIVNEEEIGRLPNLKRLSIGVFEFNRPDFLETIELGRLERLALSENRRRNFDLSPLARCETLNELYIEGHSKRIDAIASLPRLRKLRLRAYAKTHSLSFIASMPKLKELKLILGGRPDLAELSSTSVEILQIVLVRGLASLGDLSRFPMLAALKIQDQLQLAKVDLSGAQLQRLSLFNCRNLANLPGLDMQGQLREFFASGVALDLNALRDRDWPESARSVQLFSGSRKWNDDAQARLTARGLGEKNSYWI